MFIYQKKLSKEMEIILVKKAGMILALLFFGLNLSQISGTSSFFIDKERIDGIEATAGVWIPTLTMTIEPAAPDGEDHAYSEAPCVKLFSDIDEVVIYYLFSGDALSEGTVLEGVCLYPPEGESELAAWAVNDENEDWMSDMIYENFKVETKAKEGEVIINEIMWMGSFGDEKDEWIELKNMTNRNIDLSNWDIMSGGNGNGGHIEIPHGYTIKAGKYFLITAKKWDETEINLTEDLEKNEGYTHVSGMDFKDKGEQLILRSKNKDVIDTAWKDEMWPDGFKGDYLAMSMERNDEAEDGDLDSHWHTCLNEECNDEEYWREEGVNFGTPGKENSSPDNSTEMGSEDFEEKMIEKLITDSSILEKIWNDNFKSKKPIKDPKEIKKERNVLLEENNIFKPVVEEELDIVGDVGVN